MGRSLTLILPLLAICLQLAAQSAQPRQEDALYVIDGIVYDSQSEEPLVGAVVNLEENWCVTDLDGKFQLKNVHEGKYDILVKILGYVDYRLNITVSKTIPILKIKMQPASLALKDVVVTASRPKEGTGTSHEIGRDALNHLQIANVTDMASLLPGGKTVNPDLTVENNFTIRDAGLSDANAAFSTAVEVNGVRLGNNASFAQISGVDTRNISVDNIESVEVISGVPSAEYGDLGSGMVKINTKHGRSPWNINLSVNPRTYQASASKGFGIGNGSLNVSAEWTYATKKLTSPYESYNRNGLTLVYSNTFLKCLMFEAGFTGNLGGMNTKDDPDAYKGEYDKVHDNVVRANAALTWLVNKPGITDLKLDASVNFNDNYTHNHVYHSNASQLPAVHATQEGYSEAELLPSGIYFSDRVVDSKELDFAASLKYRWNKRFNGYKSALKAGVQWKANGNAGQGEYYMDPSLADNGYRPRPYSDYPYMHNLSVYAEEDFTFPFRLQLTAGLRLENVFVKGSEYKNLCSLSPRFNAKWDISKAVTVRGGWGVAEKLPSFNVLYPTQEYRDILASSGSREDGTPYYIYYTAPYKIGYNPDLKWQRTENSELGVDVTAGGFDVSVVGFYNITRNPYKFTNEYRPVTVERSGVTDVTFVSGSIQSNGAPIYRAGVEFTVNFPQIKPILTTIRLDGNYSHSKTEDRSQNYYYNEGWSHTTEAGRSYQYVGIYENGGNSSLWICGKRTDRMDANITTITHIPQARIVITCKVEISLFTRSQNIATGSTKAVYPVAYMTTDGQIHKFTDIEKDDSEYAGLIKYPGNDYTFDLDGYGAYAFANLSVTKEIGKHVSLSFFANNFTNSRPAVTSIATGVSAIFTPNFYYGLTCRIKI